MRHLEQEVSSSDQCKAEYLDNFLEIKEEIPNLILDECENFMKNEFTSDEESGSNLHLDLNNDSESDEDDTAVKKRRNRRKSLVPQKAVQLEVSQNGSMFSGSESSQDLIEKTQSLCPSDTNIDKFLLSDNLNALEMPDNDDLLNINEEDIFKDLQEEADGEKLDDEILDNVKEEWRAHWGVKCNMCEQVFPYKTEFDKHYQDNYGLIPVYTCTFCNKTAEKYSTFRSHCYRHITEGRYKCQACPKGFSLQSMLHVHVLAKHTKAKPFKCDECGKSFVTKPGLKIHLRKHKTELKEDYPCVECGKILHTRGGLTSHMNVHRLGRRFMCDVCGKTFTQKVNMQQHVKQHTGDKPHGCDKCGKTFAEKSHLARHYSFHSDQRPFKCDVCQKMYKTERCLKVHSLVHAAARPFVCSYCSKGFLSSTKLKQHFNIHTGERPYKCKYCERTFTNYPNWLKHTRRRHKVDHKTGENLGPKVPKEETSQSTVIETTDTSEQLVADISLSKTEELLLQQGLLNFPLTDDKFVIPQQIDFLAGLVSSHKWDYIHEDKWPTACKEGRKQSPIALSRGIAEEQAFSSLIFEQYDITYPVQSKNNGHSVEIRLHVQNQPTVRGGGLPDVYRLDHLHFHWESEHTMDDRRFPLELHLVHYANKYANLSQALQYSGGVAVFSVLFYLSPDDDVQFQPLINVIDKLQDKINSIQEMHVKVDDYLPRDRAGYYRYNGSLTTPDCTEGIIWTVFTNTLPISNSQVKSFPMLKTDREGNILQNYRSLQELNGRRVHIRSSPVSGASTYLIYSRIFYFVLFIVLSRFS